MIAVEQGGAELPAGTQVLRRYSVVGKLAQGGMAEVYLARQLAPPGKLVVVKRVRPHLANDQDFVGMFVNEARLAAMINHPNVVQIFDLGDQPRPAALGGGSDWFLAMEFLDGRDMLQVGRACRANNKAVPFDVTARIIADACAGLDHAHALKSPEGKSLHLVHRDMSPENVLITFDGQVKVVDFGIAKANDNLIQTQAGQIKGKLGYVAPEAILGKPLDARADVFALGATLYLFLSGRPAFTGSTPLEIFERSLKAPVPPREVNNRVPEPLDAICMRALAQDRDKRYRSAGEVRDALEQYLQSSGRSLGPVQLGQFMRILFPPEKDPVRQRIDKLLADAPPPPAQGMATAPSPAPLPVAGPPRAPAPRPVVPSPAPVVVEEPEDDDKTNIVSADVPTVPPGAPPAAPARPLPARPPPASPAGASSSPLRDGGLHGPTLDTPRPRVAAAGQTEGDGAPTLETSRRPPRSSGFATQPGTQPPVTVSPSAVLTADVEVDAVVEAAELDAPTVEVQAVRRVAEARAQIDIAAALVGASRSRALDDLRPPPLEPSGLVARPSSGGAAGPLPSFGAASSMPPPTAPVPPSTLTSTPWSLPPPVPSRASSLPPPTAPTPRLPGSGLPGSGLPGSGLPGSGLPGSGLPGSGLPPAFSSPTSVAASSPPPLPSSPMIGSDGAAPGAAFLAGLPVEAAPLATVEPADWAGADAREPPREASRAPPLPQATVDPDVADVVGSAVEPPRFVFEPAVPVPVPEPLLTGPGAVLKATMFALGSVSGVVVLFLALWLTGLSEQIFR
jgi:serine/threonine protein kinase